MSGASLITSDERPILTFDGFEPGQCLGTYELTIDQKMIQLWTELYGSCLHLTGKLPLAFAPLILMRALLTVVAPRPSGNLHVGQTCKVKEMPRSDEVLTVSVTCSSKSLKKDRRVVDFTVEVRGSDSDEAMLLGVATIFWAQ